METKPSREDLEMLSKGFTAEYINGYNAGQSAIRSELQAAQADRDTYRNGWNRAEELLAAALEQVREKTENAVKWAEFAGKKSADATHYQEQQVASQSEVERSKAILFQVRPLIVNEVLREEIDAFVK